MGGTKDILKLYNQAVCDYDNRICRFADKLVVNTNHAEDITQEVFMRLWENRQKIDFEKVKSWLFTTAYRLCMDHIKYSKRTMYEALRDEQSYSLEPPDLKQVINNALLLLNETQRSILLLKDYEGYSYAEIGELVQLNESQVKVYLFRARCKVKEYIKDLKFVL